MSPPPVPPGPYAVAGLGRAGRAAVDALCELAGPASVVAWDQDDGRTMGRLARSLSDGGVSACVGEELPTGWDAARTLVKSPGIDPEDEVIAAARSRGAVVVDELELGWRLSGAPIVAVTGTNGKSTVSGLIAELLRASGRRVSLAGNVEFGPPLSAAARQAADWIVCETSSFQLEGCPAFLPEVAVFTNLTPDHLLRHRTMSRYGAAKRRLFVRGDRAVERAVIDVDDPFGRLLARDVEGRGGTVVRVGCSSADADYRVRSCEWDLRGSTLSLATPSGELELESRLPGRYNARNVAAAVATADLLGVEHAAVCETLAGYAGLPGRFQHVDAGQPFAVVVDFAHSVDSMRQFLTALRSARDRPRRITTVLGLGGQVDPRKLRSLGAVARSLSDRLVLSRSGFRGHPWIPPLEMLLAGARGAAGGRLDVVLDRRRAIEMAVAAARPGDAVAILGRGAISFMTPGRGRALPFDDAAVARELLAAAGYSAGQTSRTLVSSSLR